MNSSSQKSSCPLYFVPGSLSQNVGSGREGGRKAGRASKMDLAAETATAQFPSSPVSTAKHKNFRWKEAPGWKLGAPGGPLPEPQDALRESQRRQVSGVVAALPHSSPDLFALSCRCSKSGRRIPAR